jgi:hypothetical protein
MAFRARLFAAAMLAAVWSSAAIAEPIFILVTGQSNSVYRIAYPWKPRHNALSWDWNLRDGHVGSVFRPISENAIDLGDSIASGIAARHRDELVYVVRIGFFAKSITHWLPGTPAPDVFANIMANVPLALRRARATRISHLFWWQGETPTDHPELYPQDFDAVMERFWSQPWLPRTTPVTIFGLAPSWISGHGFSDVYNALLRKAANAPYRQFFDTSAFDDRHWRDVGHPNGDGFYAIGQAAGRSK